MRSLLDQINASPGYSFGQLTEAELAYVRAEITAQYLDRLRVLQPNLVADAERLGLQNYHQLPIAFNHGRAWPKATRLLPVRNVESFSQMGFFQAIQREVGPTAVISHDELNWRLVRPNQPSDVGPLHADGWFWDGGYGEMPAGWDRFKIWIAIHTEKGRNGLKMLADSHTRDWKHHFEMRDGVNKPVFDEPEPEVPLLPMQAGEMVMFHDRALHGGAVNPGSTCRVSLELTVLYDPRDAARHAAERGPTARTSR
jgi:hypothetical protein